MFLYPRKEPGSRSLLYVLCVPQGSPRLSSSHCTLVKPMASISTHRQICRFTFPIPASSPSCKPASARGPPPLQYPNSTDQPGLKRPCASPPGFPHLHGCHQHPFSLVAKKPRSHLSHLCLPILASRPTPASGE